MVTKFKTVFYNLDFTETTQPPAKVTVDSYSRNMIGGPDKAQLSADPTADKWELLKLMRAPVEIYGDDGEIVWWGFVNRVTVPIGKNQRLGKGMNELFNNVVVTYDQGDTAAGTDTNSVSEYGTKEKKLRDTSLNSTNATAKRDLYLLDHKFASPEIDFSGGSSNVSIECYGWNSTLGWKHYSQTAVTTSNAHETQIAAIVTASGQFFQGSLIEDVSGLTSTPFRDGLQTAAASVSQLLAAGTSNTQPYLSYVDKDRYLHVYERTAKPTTPEYLLRNDGKLVSPLGMVVPDQECKVGVWVKPKDAPDTLDGFSVMSMFFIESAQYNVAQDETTYKAAGAYEQIRLADYISSIVTGDGGGNYTGGTVEGLNVYNVVNPTRYFETIELYQSVPQTLTPASANMVWESTYSSRGNVIEWPYDGDSWNIRANKIGWYGISWVVHGDGVSDDVVSCRLVNADNNTGYPLFPVDSTGAYGITQGYEVYIRFINTLKLTITRGTSGMSWRGTLTIVYKGT